MHRLLITLLCLFSPALLAHDGMRMEMPKGPELGASAAFDSHGRLWLVDAADGHVRLRHSDDDGRTLSAPVEVNATAERIYAEGENRPKIAFGPRDEIYVSWSQPRAEPWTGFVRFARSLDRGEHFGEPLTVHHDRAEITHRFDALTVDGKGRIVIAWIDKRDVIAATAAGKPYLGAAIYYSWSDDGGASFVPERKLVDQSCECCRIALARTPDGEVAAFFRSIHGDNIRDHAYAVLRTDGHASRVERATFSDWQIAGCPHHGPGLAIGRDGILHAVWYEAKGQPTIWYGQLDPGHAPRHPLAIAGVGASHADVAVHERTVWVAWNQVGADGYALMLRRSTDNGAHFDAPRDIARSSGAVGSPQLLLKQGHAFVAWNTAAGFHLAEVPR
ncbi:exo-alpha-sialidase [Rhodanobacter denitrificans]|uniref:Exo-alpha-sialidase n=1 Tax=Rhodanobacter denitrificans TaxID=666685 RepID=A0A368KB15_9GAMM|nr:sialidase family protein [Rhodanobacter denitrificans]RCS29054.1 exo-alpha-sialidase [Rhodanobacter denitrificans]